MAAALPQVPAITASVVSVEENLRTVAIVVLLLTLASCLQDLFFNDVEVDSEKTLPFPTSSLLSRNSGWMSSGLVSAHSRSRAENAFCMKACISWIENNESCIHDLYLMIRSPIHR
ncbi:hypothetical protein [Stappia indica]|uniref:hypothetical protein n=1 Tax=Stappia indica TaxID=538381 RepID=UPI001CD7AB6F|nr:hypothetical protein [Stappia indica]MCA1296729.1 hypothetical protein [Stappia indica]